MDLATIMYVVLYYMNKKINYFRNVNFVIICRQIHHLCVFMEFYSENYAYTIQSAIIYVVGILGVFQTIP
jgi:hypothetical protein